MPSPLIAGSHSADGYVTQSDSLFATLRAASSGSANSTGTTMYASMYGSDYDYVVFSCNRAFLAADTTIPAPADSATIDFGCYRLTSSHADAGIALVASTAASPTALVGDDYDQVGSTLLAPALVQADIPTSMAVRTFTLNAAGLAHINTSGYTQFAIRGNYYDLGNHEPATPYYDEAGERTVIATSENTTPAYRPTITINYSGGSVTRPLYAYMQQ